MAKASMALTEVVEKGASDDVVREPLAHIVKRVMDFEIEHRCGAEYGERNEDRSNSRNGYRERLWETRAGSIDLKIPKLRRGSYSGLSGAASYGGKSADRRRSRSVYPGRLNAIR